MPEDQEPVENQKVVVGMLVALLVIGAIVGVGYLYSRSKAGKPVFPSGYQPPLAASEIDCSKAKPENADTWDYYTKCDPIKFDATAKLTTHTNDKYDFSFQIPDNIQVVPFPNGLGIEYKDIPASSNLLYSIDLASARAGEFGTLTGEDYVRNYWRQYPGLAGLKSIEKIGNANKLEGYKAVYLIGSGKEGKQEVFFELGGTTGNFVHFTSGILDKAIFDTVIGSFKHPAAGSTSTTVTPSPTPRSATPTP